MISAQAEETRLGCRLDLLTLWAKTYSCGRPATVEEINAIRNHLESERPDQNPGDFSPTYEQSESVIVRNRSKHYSERLARITEAAQSPSYRIDRDDLRWLLGHVSQWFSEVEQRGETPE